MDGRDSIQSLLVLRKLTRAIAEAVRQQMTEYLATLAPLLRPPMVLGDYIQGGAKEATRRVGQGFEGASGALRHRRRRPNPTRCRASCRRRFDFRAPTWKSPRWTIRMSIQSGSETRTIMVRSPLTWTLTYTGFAPTRLPELVKAKFRAGDDMQQFVLAYLLMHVVDEQLTGPDAGPGRAALSADDHHPPRVRPAADHANRGRRGVDLPPLGRVIIESAELTGMDAFEEVVNVEELSKLRDPFKERLIAIAREQAPDLVSR